MGEEFKEPSFVRKETEKTAQIKKNIPVPVLEYEPPSWACKPEQQYQLEILKEGKIIGHFDLNRRRNETYVVIGRIEPTCDLVLEHPSISRHHCILQYGNDLSSKEGKGWHIYELGSTHGSKMNKKRLPSKQYLRMRVGFIFQFGESTRIYNLLGPDEDAEPEWECSPTEMKLKAHQRILDKKLKAAKEAEEGLDNVAKEKEKEVDGCNWGMDYGEDDQPQPILESDAHLMEDREAYYNQDPKKALTKFFEREGFEMNFEFSEQGQGHTHKWVCSIELPVEIGGVDRTFTASATVSTSKKDAQIQCALEACKILDMYGVLRKANNRLRMKKNTLEENDYYDEDDDLFYDRTGQLEEQREKRKKWAEDGYQKKPEKDTYESLCAKLEEAKKEIEECQKNLDKLAKKKDVEVKASGDSLDDYVRQLERNGADGNDAKTKTEKSKWRQKLVTATHEMMKLEKLIKIAKPVPLKGMLTMSATAGNKQSFLRKMLQIQKMKTNVGKDDIADKKSESEDKTTKVVEDKNNDCVESTEKPKQEKEILESEQRPTNENIDDKVKSEDKPVNDSEESNQETTTNSEKSTSKLMKRVAEWENELEAEMKHQEKRKKKPTIQATYSHPILSNSKIGGSEDYGVGCDDRDEKYTTWLPPSAEQAQATQDALRAKFGGKY